MSERDPQSDKMALFSKRHSPTTSCDAILKVQDKEFAVHKSIMIKCGSYFRYLFKQWSTPKQRIYEVKHMTPEIMKLVIKFAYMGFFPLTRNNMMDVMRATVQYNIKGMTNICIFFIKKQLCSENCIIIWQFTNAYFSSVLRSKALCCILLHFADVCLRREFLLLSVGELTDLLGRDDLIVRSETIVYGSVVKWINHMPEERKKHLPELMSKIRMGLMGVQYLNKIVLSNELVKNNSLCQAIVAEASKILIHWSNARDITLNHYYFRQRLPSAILLATGGWTKWNPTNTIEAYNARLNTWVRVAPGRSQARAYHGTAFVGGHIYFIGGFDGEQFFKSVHRFDPSLKIWSHMSPMKSARCYVSVTVLNGFIYALGGYDGKGRLLTAERYQPQTDQWEHIAPMHDRRSDAGCASHNGKIYICGGFNGQGNLKTAEYYNPQTNQWTLISHMRSPRSGLGVIVYRGYIYAVGGNSGSDGNNRLRTVEAYNPRSEIWTKKSHMLTTRSNFGIGVVDERIFVAGGFDGLNTTSSVEVYDGVLDKWTKVRDMNVQRSALSCCGVNGLPNMADYTMDQDGTQSDHDDEDEDKDGNLKGGRNSSSRQ